MIKIANFIKNKEYLTWKRKNITIRGMKEVGAENGVYGSYGRGLYSVPLSNKSMAKQYGKPHFVYNAIPKKPKTVNSVNEAEIWQQKLIMDFCRKHNHEPKYDLRFFDAQTTIEKEMINLGYDGLIIKGREMVNYKPHDIKYFETEDELFSFYESSIK